MNTSMRGILEKIEKVKHAKTATSLRHVGDVVGVYLPISLLPRRCGNAPPSVAYLLNYFQSASVAANPPTSSCLTWLLSQANIPAGGSGDTQPIADGIEWQKLLPL